MLENVKDFVSEKMEKVEEFCDDHFNTIYVATFVGFCGTMLAIINRYCEK